MIHAKPGRNGNSASDFIKAAYRLNKAVAECDSAFAAVLENVLHGRNYQHMTWGKNARWKDVQAMDSDIQTVRRILGDWYADIAEAARDT